MVLEDTERTVASDLKEMINTIIREKKLSLWRAKTELRDKRGKQPDIVIFDKMKNPFCVIEIKRPFIPSYQVEMFDQAYGYATSEGVNYFATFNLNILVLWSTFEKDIPLLNRRFKEYPILRISSIKELKKAAVWRSLKTGMENFLTDLSSLLTVREEEILPSLRFDAIFIGYLHSLMEAMHIPLSESLLSKVSHEPKFRKKVYDWFIKQGWNFTSFNDAVERISRQYILLFLNKIMFYNILRAEYPNIRPKEYKTIGLPEELPELKIPEDIRDGGILSHLLEGYFKKVLDIDYKTIYESSFLDEIELPKELISNIRSLANEFHKYDFTTVDYEVIGNIFESLIPPEDRHKLGQYFTRSDVVDLIVAACVRDKNDKILDPGCGAGTFLIRSYSRLKYLGAKGPHREFLNKLWGVDIAKFPAHLTTINLVVRDLSERLNFPIIACDDFFNISPSTPLSQSSFAVEGLNANKVKKEVARFNAVVTNPPYTRQEEMEEKTGEGYKDNLIELIKGETGISVGKRSSIYSYFFFHGGQFLTPKGRMGLITSNSWLDVDYGKYLQEFFLKNFKIIAIIESKVERFFVEADINTCITILEKCDNKEEMKKNIVKFVQLRETLPEVLEHFNKDKRKYDEWDDIDRWRASDDLLDWIIKTNKFMTDSAKGIRVFPVTQNSLWKEGYNTEKKRYEGSKWGKYLRAPDIFFKILDRVKSKLVLLKEVANVKPGCYSGINDFFYLDSSMLKKWQLEKRFPKPIIRTSRQISKLYVDVNKIDTKVFSCHLSKIDMKKNGFTNVLDYIEWGEKQRTRKRQKVSAGIPWPETETVKRRKPGWWAIPKSNLAETQLFMLYVINDRFLCPFSSDPITSDRCFHRIFPFDDSDSKTIWALLNSTLTAFMVEVHGRGTLGQGALKFEAMDAEQLMIVDPRQLKDGIRNKLYATVKKVASREIATIFEEVNFKDRRKLDKIVMRDILGLTNEEQLEVYKAVVDLVRSRIQKAKNAKKGKKKKESFKANIEQITTLVLHELNNELLLDVKDINALDFDCKEITVEEKGVVDVQVDLSGTPIVTIGDEKIECESLEKAHYLRYNLLMGNTEIHVPVDNDIVEKIIEKYKCLDKEIKKEVKNMLGLTVTDEKTRKKIKDRIYENVWAGVEDYEF